MSSIINLLVQSSLLFLPELTLSYAGRSKTVQNVIIDAGSGGTLFDTDLVDEIGITTASGRDIQRISGIGGEGQVFEHQVTLTIGSITIEDFTAQIGNMEQYGFTALIGLDLLLATKADINLETLTLTVK